MEEQNTPEINNSTEKENIPEQQKKSSSHLPPKKTILLIIALVIVAIGLVYLAVFDYQKVGTTNTQQEDSTAFMQTSFALSSPVEYSSSTESADLAYSIAVNMETGANMVTAFQLELLYDPNAIINVDIIPSEKTQDWAQLFRNIDEGNGIISYSLGVNLGQKGIGGPVEIANIIFSKNPEFTEDETTIKFLPKSLAAAEGEDKSVLKDSKDLTFSFLQEEPTEEVGEIEETLEQ
jgi:hypothetical protein